MRGVSATGKFTYSEGQSIRPGESVDISEDEYQSYSDEAKGLLDATKPAGRPRKNEPTSD